LKYLPKNATACIKYRYAFIKIMPGKLDGRRRKKINFLIFDNFNHTELKHLALDVASTFKW